jgi:hypothetical protein
VPGGVGVEPVKTFLLDAVSEAVDGTAEQTVFRIVIWREFLSHE